SLELRSDLGSQLAARRRPELIGKTHAHRARRKPSVSSHQVRDLLCRKHRDAVHDDQMQADGERRMGAGQLDCLAAGWPAHHETRGGQTAPLVLFEDRAVDAARKPEVIPSDDEPPQTRSSLFERNRKNSAPSRSRRLNISGLEAISQVISAILRGLK